MSTPIIAFIANKGGTGKTTTCFHIAYELFKEGSRVGIIDADEQCTLTTFALANDIEVPNNNILTAWEAAKECVLEGKDVPAATMVVPECVVDHKDRKESNEPLLLLLPGSSDLQLYERQMSSVLTYASDTSPMKPSFKKTPICMRKMLQKTAVTYKLDYTLIDMGPCGSPGNFGLFMSCDGFVVPANADHFSKMSISSITKVLKRWSTDQKMLLKRGVRIKGVSPKFIGVAFTRVPTSTKGVPIKVNQQFINESRGAIENVLLPSLVESGMCDEHVIEVGMIPKFSKVHEIAQRCKVPVFAIPVGAMDVNSKGKLVQMAPRALKNAQEQGESYRKHFTDISNNIRTFCKKHLVNIGTGDWDVDNKWEDTEEDGCMSDENGKITELETELISKEQTISSLKAEGVAAKALNDDLKKKLERLATELQDKETKFLTVIKDKDDSMESLKEKFQSEEKKKDASVQILMKEKNDILTEVAKLTESNKWKCDQISKLEAAAEAETKLKCDVQTKLEEITKQTKLREGQLLKESKDKDLEVSTLEQNIQKVDGNESVVNEHDNQLRTPQFTESQLMNNWDDVLHTTVNEDMSRKVDCKDEFGGEKISIENTVGEKRRIEHELQSGLQHDYKVDRSIVLAEELKTQKILEAQKIILSRYRKVSNVMAHKLSSLRKGTTLSRKKRRLRE